MDVGFDSDGRFGEAAFVLPAMYGRLRHVSFAVTLRSGNRKKNAEWAQANLS
jgi:hypothetical protein